MTIDWNEEYNQEVLSKQRKIIFICYFMLKLENEKEIEVPSQVDRKSRYLA